MDKLIVIDFGSQYTQLIARKIRELNVYCEVIPYQSYNSDCLDNQNIKGLILSGGPDSVVSNNTYKRIDISDRIPILGICYGAQLLVKEFGGIVSHEKDGEYGNTTATIIDSNEILNDVADNFNVWMSHNDTISKLPENWKILSKTNNGKISVYNYNNFYGVQFHPEVSHTKCGGVIFDNFLKICNCSRKWTEENFIEMSINQIRNKLGNSSKVILALSGGVDSTVLAHLIHKAIGDRLLSIVVNNGFMRKNEYENVLNYCDSFNMNIIGIDASQRFYDEIKDTTDPEQKRKIIGSVFIDVFSEIAENRNVQYLAQGTIYPDVIESVSGTGKIKSHHNVGGLPEKMNLTLLEPLRMLFKDEVRRIGLCLGISKDIVYRHPFPGPGLSLRIIGNITEEKIKILQEADDIFIRKLKEYKLYGEIWQAGVILLPIKSVGVMGDVRTYENVVALRAVESINGMTADWYDFRKDFLSDVSNSIINNVSGINRVVYDISSKPPATIEWE
jgi:GMP synthase (glutamine-hydrolysing)